MHLEQTYQILIIIGAAILIVALFKQLRLSPVLGYLVAGSIIGPFGVGLIEHNSTTEHIAEFGVVFLLFYIGLELSFERLKAMRLHVFGLGSMQFFITAIIFASIAYLCGLSLEASIVIGGGLALSSTAVVLQLLAERGEQASQVGRLSLSVLILQDLAVVPLLILVPMLGADDANLSAALLESLGTGAVVIIAIIVVGKLLIKPLFRIIARFKSQELFTATNLFIVIGSATLTSHYELSPALGAFIAGLLVAETEYRLQTEQDIKPFLGLLMGLFFMTVGMSMDLELLKNQWFVVIIITIGLIVSKGVIVTLVALLFRFKTLSALHAGAYLCQGSEFAFALFVLAKESGVLEAQTSQILLLSVTLSIAVTPLLIILMRSATHTIERIQARSMPIDEVAKESQDLDNHIIVIGFGRVGKTVASLLVSEELTNFVILDNGSKNVREGRKNGFPVYYGHADRIGLLKSLGIERAKLVVVTLHDKDMALSTVRTIKRLYPNLSIISRAKDRFHAAELCKLGADVALAEAFESSLRLGSIILNAFDIPNDEVERTLDRFRDEVYPISNKPLMLSQENIIDED